MPDRRDFLAALAGGACAAGWSAAGGAEAAARAPHDGQNDAGGRPAPPRDAPVALVPADANLGSLYGVIERLAGGEECPDSFLTGKYKSFEQFQAAGRARVRAAFAHEPPRVVPRVETLAKQDLGDYIREKIVFSTAPDLRVPAYVLIPKGLTGPAPAIVDLHSHGGMFLFGKEKVLDLGDNHPVMTRYHERNYGGRPTATALVRRGYVVITIDAFMFGERRLLLDEDLRHGWERSSYTLEVADHLNRQCRAKETTLAKSLVYAGRTWPGVITWDDQRTVDYLLTRPEVDPRRVGCVGVSLGGWRALFLAGMDDRIAAACVVGFLSTTRPMLQKHIDTHSWAHFVPALHPWLDLPDVASLRAPKPLLAQQCREDGLFPPQGMREAVDKIAEVYRRVGAADQFSGRFYEGGHRFDVAMQDDAFAWFDQRLKRD